tara:strand:- start:57 stop:548 length:492 start_codon:yes stop_codon:yes gene_type:complete
LVLRNTDLLVAIRTLKQDLTDVLDGMDNCLDWKNDPNSWSAREVIYHLIDTPAEGMDFLLRRALKTEGEAFELVPDINNMSEVRLLNDIEQVKADILNILDNLELIITDASWEELTEKTIVVDLVAQGTNEERTVLNLLQGLFIKHWSQHVIQLKNTRSSLGL